MNPAYAKYDSFCHWLRRDCGRRDPIAVALFLPGYPELVCMPERSTPFGWEVRDKMTDVLLAKVQCSNYHELVPACQQEFAKKGLSSNNAQWQIILNSSIALSAAVRKENECPISLPPMVKKATE